MSAPVRRSIDQTLPSIDTYIDSHRCATCGAAPWKPCVLKRPRHGQRWHCRRIDAGNAHRYRDIGRAPWPEEQVPGVRYDTVKNLPD